MWKRIISWFGILECFTDHFFSRIMIIMIWILYSWLIKEHHFVNAFSLFYIKNFDLSFIYHGIGDHFRHSTASISFHCTINLSALEYCHPAIQPSSSKLANSRLTLPSCQLNGLYTTTDNWTFYFLTIKSVPN